MAVDDFEPLQKKITDLLVSRLERLSVDSYWAHRASGIRGSLLRCKDDFTQVYNSVDSLDATSARKRELENQLRELMAIGYTVLENAAKEIRTADPH
jgi:alkylhydroperoxidase/carboxymuconolactone decarboxylase family protein YurZ